MRTIFSREFPLIDEHNDRRKPTTRRDMIWNALLILGIFTLIGDKLTETT